MDCICSSEKENAHGKCTSKVVDMVQAKEKRNVHFLNTKNVVVAAETKQAFLGPISKCGYRIT